MKFLFIVVLFCFESLAITDTVSPYRMPGESFQDAKSRNINLRSFEFEPSTSTNPLAQDADFKYEDFDYTSIPVLPAGISAQVYFEFIRDEKRYIWNSMPNFKRRIMWQYPDSGCFLRSFLFVQSSMNHYLFKPKKLFIFGRLKAKTQNHEFGFVRWWYHVVPIAIVDGAPIVFDPALDSSKPLALKEWILLMVPNVYSATYALCSSDTYAALSGCNTFNVSEERIHNDTQFFLKKEWERAIWLKRDPFLYLGNQAPWRFTSHFLLDL